MPKVALDFAPAFVGEQLRPLLPGGVDFDAMQAQTDEELARCAHNADVLISTRTPINARTLRLIPGVRFIQHAAIGYDNLDLTAVRVAGIAVANNAGFCATSVAEHTLMLMLLLLHRFMEAEDATRSGGFPMYAFLAANRTHLRELGDQTVGLVGLGNMGKAVAERLIAFGTRVLYHARHRADDATEARLGVRYAQFDDLLASASIVSLHLPSSPETRHMIGARQLAQMQPRAFLINTSRGDLIDEAALREAIIGGGLAGAGLDVVEDEPKEVNPFADLPQVIVTPHIAGISETSAPRAIERAAANVGRFLRGQPVLNVVTA
jgi:phosphoglycerate dehydrogenase-like enzyme